MTDSLLLDRYQQLLVEWDHSMALAPTYPVHWRRMVINAMLLSTAKQLGVTYPPAYWRHLLLRQWHAQQVPESPLLTPTLDWAAQCGWPRLDLYPAIAIGPGEAAWRYLLGRALPAEVWKTLSTLTGVEA